MKIKNTHKTTRKGDSNKKTEDSTFSQPSSLESGSDV